MIKAYESENLDELEKAIIKARAINDPSMKQPLALASRLRDRVAAKNNLRDMILNADIRTIYELRKLVHPPDGVHQTIKAALILLDSPRQEVEVKKGTKSNTSPVNVVKWFLSLLFMF